MEEARQSTTSSSALSSNAKSQSISPLNVQKFGVGVKAQQRRVLVIGVHGVVCQSPVFQRLHEVNGKEAFSYTAFAVEDEVDLLGHSVRVRGLEVARIGGARAASAGRLPR